MADEQHQGSMGKLKAVLGFGLVIISGAFALTMVMRFVGRFLIFLVVDPPEIGFGFLLSTFATTALGIYVAWQVGKKGVELSSRGRSPAAQSGDESAVNSPATRTDENQHTPAQHETGG